MIFTGPLAAIDSDLERWDARQIFRRISLIRLVSFDLERPNSAGQHMWGGEYFQGRGSATLPR